MNRVTPITPENASPEVKEIFTGMNPVLNIFRCMANSPATLKGFLEFSKSAGKTSLNPKLREAIALTVAESNDCGYCLAAHSSTAVNKLKFSTDEVIQARKGESSDEKTNAILQFVREVVEKRAKITDADIKELKSEGVTDQEIVEIIFVTMVNMFTNYFNHIADPKIDFPVPVTIK